MDLGLLLALLLAAGAHAADPVSPDFAVSAALSTNVIHVGDVFRLTLTADHPRGAAVQPPRLDRGKDLVVRTQKAATRNTKPGLARTTVTYDLTTFVVSNQLVTAGPVQFLLADGTTVERTFPAQSLEVRTTLADPQVERRDIKDLARWPAQFPRWIVALFIVAILAAIAAVLASRFLSKPRTILQHPPAPPPHEIAFAALRDLLAKGWIEAGQVEPFYVGLSAIVRRYLEDRFGLRAPERTTEEFIREATGSRHLSPAHQQLTRDFLEQSDMVKFARHRPAQDDMKTAYSSAERLVRETIPAAPNPEPETGNREP